ncbi:MAG: GreA/GreB family elongation factor [Deltaproteobacteria bacterium]|nr:GreA/GreB family elongation factor [Deltaproteobacteria bacterium]
MAEPFHVHPADVYEEIRPRLAVRVHARMRKRIDKRVVLGALRERIAGSLAALTASQNTAQSGAIHEETRQEHPKDTRAIEAGYLARGLAERVETLRDAVVLIGALKLVDYGPTDPIGICALVGLEGEVGEEQVYFLAPTGAGERLVIEGTTIQSLTPGSPLGRALLGRRAGDEVEVALPNGMLRACIAWVR